MTEKRRPPQVSYALYQAAAPAPPGPASGPGRETSAHATDLLELAADAGYTSLVCISAAVVFVVASIGSDWVLRISTAVGLAVGAHMILVLFMVMKREFTLTQQRLNRARTGADRTLNGVS